MKANNEYLKMLIIDDLETLLYLSDFIDYDLIDRELYKKDLKKTIKKLKKKPEEVLIDEEMLE